MNHRVSHEDHTSVTGASHERRRASPSVTHECHGARTERHGASPGDQHANMPQRRHERHQRHGAPRSVMERHNSVAESHTRQKTNWSDGASLGELLAPPRRRPHSLPAPQVFTESPTHVLHFPLRVGRSAPQTTHGSPQESVGRSPTSRTHTYSQDPRRRYSRGRAWAARRV